MKLIFYKINSVLSS